MKKENKELARARRAQERRQAEMAQMRKILLIVLVIIAVVAVLVAVMVVKTKKEQAEEQKKLQGMVLMDDPSLTVENGDKVNLDYIGYVDNVEFEGGNSFEQGYDLVIGSHSFIDDFEEQLIGYHPGDLVEVNVTFPDNYYEDLAGKDARFEVTIHGIYR